MAVLFDFALFICQRTAPSKSPLHALLSHIFSVKARLFYDFHDRITLFKIICFMAFISEFSDDVGKFNVTLQLLIISRICLSFDDFKDGTFRLLLFFVFIDVLLNFILPLHSTILLQVAWASMTLNVRPAPTLRATDRGKLRLFTN
jgi:hypothetical protein